MLTLPGHLFFVESVELPTALEANEIADFAELTVESIAPFPLEQIHWGFLHAPDATHLLIYAAHRDRLKKHSDATLDAYAWVLPDFAHLQGAHFPEATEVTLLSESCVTLLHFESEAEVPCAAASLPLGSKTIASVIATLRKETEGNDHFARKRSLRLIDTTVSEQGLPTFYHVEDGADNGSAYGNWSELNPSEKLLWQADIRSGEFKESERSARRTSALIAKITAWAALFALLLVGLEILLMAGNAWLGTKTNLIAQQRPGVERIQGKEAFINKVETFAPENELRPIAILEALNTTRPKGIYFTSTEASGENQIKVDGIASTINEFNRYTESLSNSGIFSLLGNPKQLTRSGKTTFTVELDYHHRQAAVATPKPAPTASPKPTADETNNPEATNDDSPNVDEAKAVIVEAEAMVQDEPVANPRRNQLVKPEVARKVETEESSE